MCYSSRALRVVSQSHSRWLHPRLQEVVAHVEANEDEDGPTGLPNRRCRGDEVLDERALREANAYREECHEATHGQRETEKGRERSGKGAAAQREHHEAHIDRQRAAG